MLWTLAITLTILWLLLFAALKMTVWPVHLLLLAAVAVAVAGTAKNRRG